MSMSSSNNTALAAALVDQDCEIKRPQNPDILPVPDSPLSLGQVVYCNVSYNVRVVDEVEGHTNLVLQQVPIFLIRAFARIRGSGLTVEGIFRKEGAATRLNQYATWNVYAGMASIPDALTVLDVCVMVKRFVKGLQRCLVDSQQVRKQLYAMAERAENGERIERKEFCAIFDRQLKEGKLEKPMSPEHIGTLAYICRQLQTLAKFSNVTNMAAENLAIVFGPNFFREDIELAPPAKKDKKKNAKGSQDDLLSADVVRTLDPKTALEKAKEENAKAVAATKLLIQCADWIGLATEIYLSSSTVPRADHARRHTQSRSVAPTTRAPLERADLANLPGGMTMGGGGGGRKSTSRIEKRPSHRQERAAAGRDPDSGRAPSRDAHPSAPRAVTQDRDRRGRRSSSTAVRDMFMNITKGLRRSPSRERRERRKSEERTPIHDRHEQLMGLHSGEGVARERGRDRKKSPRLLEFSPVNNSPTGPLHTPSHVSSHSTRREAGGMRSYETASLQRESSAGRASRSHQMQRKVSARNPTPGPHKALDHHHQHMMSPSMSLATTPSRGTATVGPVRTASVTRTVPGSASVSSFAGKRDPVTLIKVAAPTIPIPPQKTTAGRAATAAPVVVRSVTTCHTDMEEPDDPHSYRGLPHSPPSPATPPSPLSPDHAHTKQRLRDTKNASIDITSPVFAVPGLALASKKFNADRPRRHTTPVKMLRRNRPNAMSSGLQSSRRNTLVGSEDKENKKRRSHSVDDVDSTGESEDGGVQPADGAGDGVDAATGGTDDLLEQHHAESRQRRAKRAKRRERGDLCPTSPAVASSPTASSPLHTVRAEPAVVASHGESRSPPVRSPVGVSTPTGALSIDIQPECDDAPPSDASPDDVYMHSGSGSGVVDESAPPLPSTAPPAVERCEFRAPPPPTHSPFEEQQHKWEGWGDSSHPGSPLLGSPMSARSMSIGSGSLLGSPRLTRPFRDDKERALPEKAEIARKISSSRLVHRSPTPPPGRERERREERPSLSAVRGGGAGAMPPPSMLPPRSHRAPLVHQLSVDSALAPPSSGSLQRASLSRVPLSPSAAGRSMPPPSSSPLGRRGMSSSPSLLESRHSSVSKVPMARQSSVDEFQHSDMLKNVLTSASSPKDFNHRNVTLRPSVALLQKNNRGMVSQRVLQFATIEKETGRTSSMSTRLSDISSASSEDRLANVSGRRLSSPRPSGEHNLHQF